MTRPPLPLVIGMLALMTAVGVMLWPIGAAEPDTVAPWRVRLDLNGDGCISRAESDQMAWRDAPYDLLDADGDGCLGDAELETLLLRIDPHWIEAEAR